MSSNTFDRIAFISFILTIGLLPIFFLPYSSIPIETSKSLLVVVGLGVTSLFWGIARFFDGKISIPRSGIMLSTFFITLAALVSALLSPAPKWSLFGVMLDVGTFFFFLAAFLLALFAGIYSRSREGERVILGTIIASIFILLAFQLIRIFIPDLLSFGVLKGKIGNLFGSWNTVGFVAGLGLVLSLFSFDSYSKNWLKKGFIFLLFVISLALSLIINFSLAWGMIAAWSLIVFVLKILHYARERQSPEAHATFPVLSLLTLVFSIVFLLVGAGAQAHLPTKLEVLNSEIRPNFESTWVVGKAALMESPVLGSGPNRFAEMWALYKSEKVNESQFWNVNFDFGSGILPTFVVTLGALGALGFLSLIVFLLRDGLRATFASARSGQSGGATSFFLASSYLLAAALLYPVGGILLFLCFIMLGMFTGSYAREQSIADVEVRFLEDPRKSFFAIIFLVLFIIATAVLSFKFLIRFSGTHYYTQALSSTDIVEAETLITQAVSRNYNDLFLRTKSQIHLARIQEAAEKNPDPPEELAAELQNVFDAARDSAAAAAAYNSKSYLNFQAQGALYEISGFLFGVEDSYSKALASYQSAAVLNPKNPGIKLAIARSYWLLGQPNDAKELARQALFLKPNYVEVMIFLSQAAKIEGDLATARLYADQALALEPKNPELIKYIETLNVE